MSDENFYKQRRNLLWVSSLVVFLNTTAGTIEKMTLLGTEIKFANPKLVPWILGGVVAYLFVRYLQYAHEIEDKGFKTRFWARCERYLGPGILKREHKVQNSKVRRAYPDIRGIRIEKVQLQDQYENGLKVKTAEASFVGKGGGAVVTLSGYPVSTYDLVWPAIRAAIYIILRTRLVTDYIFPIAFSLFALATFWWGFPKLLLIKT